MTLSGHKPVIETYEGRLSYRESNPHSIIAPLERTVREMELSYFGKLRQEGMHVILLQLLQDKFGELPQATIDRLEATESQDALTALATKILTVESLEDLGLDGAGNQKS